MIALCKLHLRRFNLFSPLVLLCLTLLCAGSSRGYAQPHQTASVLAVVDGDTLRISLDGKRQLLRLIGVDTPESRPNPRAERQAARSASDTTTILELGSRATRVVEQLVPVGSTIQVEFDVERHDRYGRLLGYAYLPNGDMLNERLLSLGYAHPLTVPPNIRYAARLRAAFQAGRAAQRGLWNMPGFEREQASNPPARTHPPLPSMFRK